MNATDAKVKKFEANGKLFAAARCAERQAEGRNFSFLGENSAGERVVHSAWAKAFCRKRRMKGAPPEAAVRTLAYKWIRIIWRLCVGCSDLLGRRVIINLSVNKTFAGTVRNPASLDGSWALLVQLRRARLTKLQRLLNPRVTVHHGRFFFLATLAKHISNVRVSLTVEVSHSACERRAACNRVNEKPKPQNCKRGALCWLHRFCSATFASRTPIFGSRYD